MSFNEEKNREENLKAAGELGESIRDFRAALNHLAERETATPMTANWLAPARRRQRRHHQHLALAWACAALLCAATTLPFMLHSNAPASHPATQAISATKTVTTAASEAPQTGLLEQVDEDVSESVPSSLAPLAEMDNLNSSNASSDEPTMENTNVAH